MRIRSVAARRVGVTGGVMLFACAGGAVESDVPFVPGTHVITVEHGGRERSAWVHVPGTSAAGSALPVVVSFHGGGGTASGHRAQTGFEALAEAEGFIAVHPEGTPPRRFMSRLRTWNAGTCCGKAAQDAVDDVGFTIALLDALAARAPVDLDRVLVTGHSNGGMMALRVAGERPDRVAAVVSVGAITPPPEGGALRRPVLHVHSVDDPRAPYQGGLGPPFPLTNRRVAHVAVEPVMAQWRSAAGCAPIAAVAETREQTFDGALHSATLLAWDCPGTMRVEHWRLTGAGHGWPGSRKPGRERVIGPFTAVIDASIEAWRFFERAETGAVGP